MNNEVRNLKINSILDRFGITFAVVIVGFSIITFFTWSTSSPLSNVSENISFKYIEDKEYLLNPELAAKNLNNNKSVFYIDTKRSEFPFWISFKLPSDSNKIIELPSRHALEYECWLNENFKFIETGKGSRIASGKEIIESKAGFILKNKNPNSSILCRSKFVGPARISVQSWDPLNYEKSLINYERYNGLLEGGMFILAAFIFVAALINKEWTYLIFSAWLIANLRLAELSAGWDTTWFGYKLPSEWMSELRKIAFAVYYSLSIGLFSRLFRKELSQVGYQKWFSLMLWSTIPVCLSTIFLSYKNFLPLIWVTGTFTVITIGFFSLRILIKTPSRVAVWYFVSWPVLLLPSLYEVIAAAFGIKIWISYVNSVTAALASSLLSALAIAEQMRQERSQRIAAQAQAVSALAKVKANFEASPIGLFSMKENGEFLQYNPAMEKMLNLKSGPALNWQDVFSKAELDKMVAALNETPHYEVKFSNTVIIPPVKKFIFDDSEKPVQQEHWYFLQASLAEGIIEASLQEITEQKKAFDQLDFLAYHDSLTLALNQRGIAPILEKALEEATAGKPTALAYIDLDRFKLVNDLYGHLAGDEVLKTVVTRIQTMLGKGHELARIGGDEFIVVLRDTSIDSARAFCEAFLHLIESRNYIVEEKAFRVKASIGLVEVAENLSARDVIAAADRACYQAKKGNHNNLVIYTKESKAVRERIEEIQLVEALSSDASLEGLFLEMQPIMSTQTPYQTLDFEALVRMRNSEGVVIPAGRLISAAESNGRIAIIDRWVLRTMLAWMYENHHLLNRTRFACVNISGGSLNDERFVQDIRAMLSDYRQVTAQLCLEITEAVALQDLNNTRRFVDELQALGAKVALDDFGAGYTSFAYLKNLTADAVKIDGAFIRDLNRHPANYGIAKGIVDLAHNLGMRSVAEWVEDRATLETLLEIGVDYVQGYAIAKPMAPAAILACRSAADFIQDESIANFVRSNLDVGGQPELWDALPPENVVHFKKS